MIPGDHAEKRIEELLWFINNSPGPASAIQNASLHFEEAGFVRLEENQRWHLEPGNRYYLVRNGGSIVAFYLGSDPIPETGIRIATAHTDSPALKIKPASESTKGGSVRVSVEVYGGPIYHSWLDRSLGVAGEVVVRNGESLEVRSFVAERPIAVIPNLAIHLNRDVNKGFTFNPQDHLKAILSTGAGADNGAADKAGDKAGDKADGGAAQSSSVLVSYIASVLSVPAERIVDFDLYLHDAHPGEIIGTEGDMIVSGRLDNLAMCHALISALSSVSNGARTKMVVLFDSEEIGSRTLHGAGSNLLRSVVERLIASGESGAKDDLYRTLARSTLVSGDAAHAVHPSYADKHDEHYLPVINGGPVIKINAGKRYTSTAYTSAIFEELCRTNDIPVQRFIGRSDTPSGGTVGPIVSSDLGVPSVDIGHPIWAMHSIRETGGCADHGWVIRAIAAYFESETSWR